MFRQSRAGKEEEFFKCQLSFLVFRSVFITFVENFDLFVYKPVQVSITKENRI